MGKIQTVKKYRPGKTITETIVDGDVYKIEEEYKLNGQTVYIYEYYPTPDEMMKAYGEKFKR